MSFMSALENDLAILKRWFDSSPIGRAIEDDFKAAVAELEAVGAHELENAVKAIGLSVLGALAIGGGAPAAIQAGISTAITQFKVIEKEMSAKTLNTLVTTVVNQVSGQLNASTPIAQSAV